MNLTICVALMLCGGVLFSSSAAAKAKVVSKMAAAEGCLAIRKKKYDALQGNIEKTEVVALKQGYVLKATLS